jgi:hypothetical protein
MSKPKPNKDKTKGSKINDLPEAEIINLMKNQLGRKLTTHAKNFKIPGTKAQQGSEGKTPGTVVSPGLKLRNKEDNTLVTVDSVGQHTVVISLPNGELYNIRMDELDEKFELD